MFARKLKTAIQKYLDADTGNSKSGAKGAIAKLIDDASATDVMLIPDILRGFDGLPNWLKLRFQKGSLYREGGRVFGWYREGQVQAVELPVDLDIFSYDDEEVGLRVVEYIIALESISMGFAPPIDLPLRSMDVFFSGGNYRVDVSLDSDSYWELLAAGYASPCALQWSWIDKEYVVERSIISHGFWKAWEWWPECWQFYYQKWPELFQDAEWWATDVDSGQTV